jgi:hypothetical protein
MTVDGCPEDRTAMRHGEMLSSFEHMVISSLPGDAADSEWTPVMPTRQEPEEPR